MARGKTFSERLQASYFDTAEGALSAHGIVVRLRKEGRRWVQTAKGPTDNLLERLEHNVAVPAQGKGRLPTLDLIRHRGTPVGDAIDKALGVKGDDNYPSLLFFYGTDIKRITTRIACDGSMVEVALDRGCVFTEGATKRRSQPICELEFELIEGSTLAAVALARQWCSAHHLWLSTIAKSMKGKRLQQVVPHGAATSAIAPSYARKASANEMVTAVIASCLGQIVPNMSELADWKGSSSEQPEHIHQLRVGIRRLRTAFRELGDLTDGMDPHWEAALVNAFRALGAHRDQSYLAHSLQPQLVAAGGPAVRIDENHASQLAIQDIARAADFQDALLGLIAFLRRNFTPAPGNTEPLKKTISHRLDKLYKNALNDGKKFLTLDDEQQHVVRKRLKRLRYLIEFAAPLFARRKAHHMVAALKPVQDALGLYNDELMALQAWRVLAERDAKAWFGIGWLTARKRPNARQCLEEIKKLAVIKPFWRH